MNLETEGKINLLVTFIQRFVTQSKLSLIFIKTLYFFTSNRIFFEITNACKNADGNSKFHITKLLNPRKIQFLKTTDNSKR